MDIKLKQQKRIKRSKRTRSKIFGRDKRPRLSVFRSNKYIYLQAIDDEKGKTIASAGDLEKKGKSEKGGGEAKVPLFSKNGQRKIENARLVGAALAKKLKNAKIKKIVFDRGGYKYHGRVKSLADGLRKGGIKI